MAGAVVIRDEQPADAAVIRDVNRRAFAQNQEAAIVDALRSNGGVLLSLVAALDREIVGHILYSPLTIGSATGAALGPMSVLPAHQRRAIGSRLVEEGNRRLAVSGCPFVVVLGHPGFYPRFGFKPASTYDITCEWAVPDDVFMALVLDQSKTPPAGLAQYRPEFSTIS